MIADNYALIIYPTVNEIPTFSLLTVPLTCEAHRINLEQEGVLLKVAPQSLQLLPPQQTPLQPPKLQQLQQPLLLPPPH